MERIAAQATASPASSASTESVPGSPQPPLVFEHVGIVQGKNGGRSCAASPACSSTTEVVLQSPAPMTSQNRAKDDDVAVGTGPCDGIVQSALLKRRRRGASPADISRHPLVSVSVRARSPRTFGIQSPTSSQLRSDDPAQRLLTSELLDGGLLVSPRADDRTVGVSGVEPTARLAPCSFSASCRSASSKLSRSRSRSRSQPRSPAVAGGLSRACVSSCHGWTVSCGPCQNVGSARPLGARFFYCPCHADRWPHFERLS